MASRYRRLGSEAPAAPRFTPCAKGTSNSQKSEAMPCGCCQGRPQLNSLGHAGSFSAVSAAPDARDRPASVEKVPMAKCKRCCRELHSDTLVNIRVSRAAHS
eukprot:5208355-Prymnesium_polylepis.1